jgi:hypothetical protein
MFHTHFYLEDAFAGKKKQNLGTFKKQQPLEIEKSCIEKHPIFFISKGLAFRSPIHQAESRPI